MLYHVVSSFDVPLKVCYRICGHPKICQDIVHGLVVVSRLSEDAVLLVRISFQTLLEAILSLFRLVLIKDDYE